MTPRNRFIYFNLGLSKMMHHEMSVEAHRLGISKQAFMRSLIQDYFLRMHGRDVILESHKLKYSDDRDYPKTDERN